MKRSRIVLLVVTALLVLSFMAGPVSAEDEPPIWEGELPDLSEFTPRYDDGFPPEPITVDVEVVPVSPVNELVYSRLPKLYFKRDFRATQYRVEIRDLINPATYSVNGAGTCDPWYCYLQPPSKLDTYGHFSGIYSWNVQKKVDGVWYGWSPAAIFVVMSKGFTSTFDTNRANWYDIYGTWTQNNGKLKTLGSGANLWDSVSQWEQFIQIDFSVTMKRKATSDYVSCLFLMGDPFPLGADKQWNDGVYFCYGNNKNFGVFVNENGTSHWLSPGYLPSKAIKAYDWNTLRVVIAYPYVDFWINSTWVGYGATSQMKEIGYVGVTMCDSWEAKDPLLVDRVVVIADQKIKVLNHDPALMWNPIPMDPDFNPGVIPADGGASGTR